MKNILIYLLLAAVPLLDPTSAYAAIAPLDYSEAQGLEYGAPRYDPDSPDCMDPGLVSSPGAETVTGNAQSFTDAYIQHAYDVSLKTGVPWEIIMGQASLESGWGRSTLTTKYFNFFGIKASSNTPESEKAPPLPTTECSGGNCSSTTAVFRRYTSATDSFNDHARLMLTSRYLPAMKFQKDPQAYITAVWKAGYATDPDYANKVMSRVGAVVKALGDRYGNTYKPSSELVFPQTPSVDGTPSASVNAGDTCTATALSQTSTGATVGDFAWIIDRKWYNNPSTHYWVMKGHQANSGFYYKYGDGQRYAVDISPPGINGEPQYALTAGVVTRVGLPGSRGSNGGLEITSTLPNGKKLKHLYVHGTNVTKKVGEQVKTGEQVARVGSVGNSRTPHVHMEINYDGSPICGNDIFTELAKNNPVNLDALAKKASPNCLGRATKGAL